MFFNMGIPNCVPEYYRSQQEEYDRECEKQYEFEERCAMERERVKKREEEGCARLDFPPDECRSCSQSDEVGCLYPDDDWDSILCAGWKTCGIFRKETMEKFPNVPWEEIVSWYDGVKKQECEISKQ